MTNTIGEKVLKYGSFSSLIFHINYTIDEDLKFLSQEIRKEHKEKIRDIIEKFLVDNKLELNEDELIELKETEQS